MSSFFFFLTKTLVLGVIQFFLKSLPKPDSFKSQVGIALFWKNKAESESQANSTLYWWVQERLPQPTFLNTWSHHKICHLQYINELLPQHISIDMKFFSIMVFFLFLWGREPRVRVTYRLIKGSLAFHKGESLQAVAATAKKSTALGKNKTQTRAHCECYLLLHNKPSHSLGWVSGVQPLSSRPAFDLWVEMRRGLALSCGDRTTPPPGCSY